MMSYDDWKTTDPRDLEPEEENDLEFENGNEDN